MYIYCTLYPSSASLVPPRSMGWGARPPPVGWVGSTRSMLAMHAAMHAMIAMPAMRAMSACTVMHMYARLYVWMHGRMYAWARAVRF